MRTVRPCPTCSSENHLTVYVKDGHTLVRCVDCDLVFVRDLPTPDELAALYDSDDYHTESEQRTKSFTARAAVHSEVLERFSPTKGRVLDIGCSDGYFLRNVRDRGWSTSGVELSSRSVETARSVHGLDVVTGTVDDAPWPAGSFDVVTMWDVVEHLPEPGAVLVRVSELLRPGGLLIMATPAVDGLYPRVSLRMAPITGWWGHPEPPYHLQQYGKKTITDLCMRHGFSVTAIVDDLIDLGYSFGLTRDVKRMLSTVVMLPLAAIGPKIHMGDSMFVVAAKGSTE